MVASSGLLLLGGGARGGVGGPWKRKAPCPCVTSNSVRTAGRNAGGSRLLEALAGSHSQEVERCSLTVCSRDGREGGEGVSVAAGSGGFSRRRSKGLHLATASDGGQDVGVGVGVGVGQTTL
ncbi:hypothetical protein BDZ91DRAFT_160318 [Kalaharituber pfeilii]|nr:hypothetical protein BDZ91DRAFT_160318 [Kalaharituber pfeilii]